MAPSTGNPGPLMKQALTAGVVSATNDGYVVTPNTTYVGGGVYTTTTDTTMSWSTSPPAPCEHVMDDETELDDGRIAGYCSKCGDKITGRRLVGGMGLAKLKAALVDAIGDEGALAELANELARVDKMMELERQAIAAAECLMDTARCMIEELLDL